jgi:hypothetical protein
MRAAGSVLAGLLLHQADWHGRRPAEVLGLAGERLDDRLDQAPGEESEQDRASGGNQQAGAE